MEKTVIKQFKLEIVGDDFEDEAFAAVAKNKAFNYLKFILTDDQPNANKQQVPVEEFENLINSGYFTPIKMAYKTINDGHEESFPLGVITHLTQDQDNIKGIAALWSRERPEDVNFVKDAYSKKIPLNISWEIMYGSSEFTPEGIEILRDTSLRAATIVGLPAYEGRTPIYAFASKDGKPNLEDKEKMELEELKVELEALKAKHTDVTAKFEEASKNNDELKTQLSELEELRGYKASAEADKAKADKLVSIRNKFTEAGIEKEDEYFTSNEELLLNLSEAALDFMIQELVAFSAKKEGKASTPKIPNLEADPKENDLSNIVKALKERNTKK